MFPLDSTLKPNIIKLSLITGYVPKPVTVTVIKWCKKRPTLDPEVQVIYITISNLPFHSNILHKAVA